MCIRDSQTGKQVVVLIDEYDKPLLQALSDEKLTEEYRRILKAFYGVLKSCLLYTSLFAETRQLLPAARQSVMQHSKKQ